MTSASSSRRVSLLHCLTRTIATVAVACLLLLSRSADAQDKAFVFPTTGVSVEKQATFLAIDNISMPLVRNLRRTLSKPTVRPEPVLTPNRDNPNAPDYLATHFYGTVLFDQDKYRMWYYACHKDENPDWPDPLKAQAAKWKREVIPGPLCYAESADGIHWEKPNLGQLMFKGSRDNNAFDLPSALTGDACVIKDMDDPDPNRRYKLAFWSQFDPYTFPTMRLATSPDGIHWTTAPQPPIPHFLEHASFYKFNGYYFANSQTLQPRDEGETSPRVGTAWISPDFDHWLSESAESFALPYQVNPERDEVHLGIGGSSFGNVLVGLYCIWHNHPEFGKISGDFGLVVSNDGLTFREPEKGFVWLKASESPVTPIPDKALPTVLCQANGILNVGEETRIYHGRWRNSEYGKPGIPAEDYWGEVALATLPRDRWGALTLINKDEEGCAWTAPVTLPRDGGDIFLNGEVLNGLCVEIADERFGLLPGYADADAGKAASASGFDCMVVWPKGDLRELGGKTVRFKVGFKKEGEAAPGLYALYLRSAAKRSTEVAGASVVEFNVPVGKRSVNARLLSPTPDKLAADPALLLTFAMDRRLSTSIKPYCLATEYFLAQGHRVLSFDLPMHGERVDTYGSDIAGMRNAFVSGKDVFAEFVEEGRAVIDECIRRGWARPGRIAVAGTSRGGYMALRLMAGDDRIAAGAGFAPVTDWTLLREFAEDRERADVQALRLANFVPQLAGRRVYLAIGSKDERVGTDSCKQLAEQLAAIDPQCVEFHLTEDEGHSLNDSWYGAGRESLLKWLQTP